MVQASWDCNVVCALASDQGGQHKCQLEVSQDTNCGWRDVMVQASWACDVGHMYHWLRRRETGLLGSGQKFKKLAG